MVGDLPILSKGVSFNEASFFCTECIILQYYYTEGKLMMTKEQSEQLQADIITHCDGLDETLIDNLCQVVVDYYKEQADGE